jgi:hypothetical protein
MCGTTHHLHRAPLGILRDASGSQHRFCRQLRTAKTHGANSRSTEHVLREPALSRPTPATPGPQRTSQVQSHPIKETLPTYGSPPTPQGVMIPSLGSVHSSKGESSIRNVSSTMGTPHWKVYTPQGGTPMCKSLDNIQLPGPLQLHRTWCSPGASLAKS